MLIPGRQFLLGSAPLSGPAAIGQLLPKCRRSQMRQLLPITADWRLLESGHLSRQLVGCGPTGLYHRNHCGLRFDCFH
jgi:hypothetical protein